MDVYSKTGGIFRLCRDGTEVWKGSEVGILWDEKTLVVVGHGDPGFLARRLQTHHGDGVLAVSAHWTADDLNRVMRDHGAVRFLAMGDAVVTRREPDPLSMNVDDFVRARLAPEGGRGNRELTATVRRVIYCRDGYSVVEAVTAAGLWLTAAGSAVEDELKVGGTYVFLGRWTTHPKHGDRFSFDTTARDLPVSREGVLGYFRTSLKGIGFGPRSAEKLWARYGHHSLLRLIEDPAGVAVATGLKESCLLKAREVIRADAGTIRTRVALHSLLAGRRFPRSAVTVCLEEWGASAPEVIRRNPFALLERGIPGAGFDRVDRLYCDLALPPDNATRQAWCAWDAVHSDRFGNTWITDLAARSHVMTKLGMPATADRAVRDAVSRELLVARSEGGKKWVTTPARATAEADLVEAVLSFLAEPPTLWPDPSSVPGLTSHQGEQLALSLRGRIGLLSGSPGTGKTRVSMSLLKTLTDSGLLVGVVAPTGKAAVRCTEVMRSPDIGVNGTATTMHRALRVVGKAGGWEFEHGRENPMPYDVLLADEQSMTDTDMMACILSACRKGCHVLLVGDPHQLPPVGHGAPFRDLLDSKVPSGTLQEIHRFCRTRVAVACSEIRDRKRFSVSPRLDLEAGENLRHQHAATPAAAIASLRQLFAALGRTGRFDLIEDVQVICAVNDGTDLSRSSLNELLQNELNPRGVSVAGSFYRVGDKVLCRSNSAWPSVRPRRSSSTNAEDWEIVQVYGEDGYEDEQLFVANGDMGRVLAVSSSSVVVRFFAPDRVVRVRTIGEDTDDRLLELGYAATSHKMQGSESRVVIVMIDDSPRAAMVASREWVYTAISRTKEMCALIGDIDVMRRWCDTASLPGRQTLVRPMLRTALA